MFQLDAEFTSLVKIQIDELQKEIARIKKCHFTTEDKAEKAKLEVIGL